MDLCRLNNLHGINHTSTRFNYNTPPLNIQVRNQATETLLTSMKNECKSSIHLYLKCRKCISNFDKEKDDTLSPH